MSEESIEKTPGKFGAWIRKHKVLCIVLAAAAVIAVIIGITVGKVAKTVSEVAQNYQFVRTVTLQKGDLENVVSANGTVASGVTSTVTYSQKSAMYSIPKVKEVNVAVGDLVEEGDVVVTLDGSDIQKSIDSEIESRNKRIEKAKEAYDDALESYEKAKDKADEYRYDYRGAEYDRDEAEDDFRMAKISVATFQKAYDNAYDAEEKAGLTYNRVLSSYQPKADRLERAEKALYEAESAYNTAFDAWTLNPEDLQLKAALDRATAQRELAQQELDVAKTAISEAEEQKVHNAETAYQQASLETADALAKLNGAKANCNYMTYEAAFNAADMTYNQMKSMMEQLDAQVESAEKMRDNAKSSYDDALENSDSLDDLYEQLEACNLKAETKGKVTALNVGVGDTPAGVIASIQDTDSLKIVIAIQEADIHKVELGMPCRITSDATEEPIEGKLTQIDPISLQGGVFGAEVTVTGNNSGLLVGMNASVDIILSSKENCFIVPIDAVGNDGSGDYIYRSTGGTGINMTFEKVSVTTGQKNDYYIEVSGASLKENDVIRASADLSQGLETEVVDPMQELYESMQSGAMAGRPDGGAKPQPPMGE